MVKTNIWFRVTGLCPHPVLEDASQLLVDYSGVEHVIDLNMNRHISLAIIRWMRVDDKTSDDLEGAIIEGKVALARSYRKPDWVVYKPKALSQLEATVSSRETGPVGLEPLTLTWGESKLQFTLPSRKDPDERAKAIIELRWLLRSFSCSIREAYNPQAPRYVEMETVLQSLLEQAKPQMTAQELETLFANVGVNIPTDITA